jgi:hypothetical protein
MVFNIVIVSVLVILIIHYSIDYLKSFLNPLPPSLEDLKYKKYKTIIDEMTRPKVEPVLGAGKEPSIPGSNPVLDLDQEPPNQVAEPSPGSDPDLQSYFQTMYDFNSIMDFDQ